MTHTQRASTCIHPRIGGLNEMEEDTYLITRESESLKQLDRSEIWDGDDSETFSD